MTTPSDLILSALQSLRQIAAGDSLPGEDADDGLTKFNRMMHGLKTKGVDLGWADIGLDDTIPVAPEYDDAIENLLAVALAPRYGTELTPELAVAAADSLSLLQAHFKRAPLLTAPEGTLDRVRGDHGWNINSGP